jgi:hypothetical protein
MMYENVISGLAADESVTLFIVKPFNRAFFLHYFLCLLILLPQDKIIGSLVCIGATGDPGWRHLNPFKSLLSHCLKSWGKHLTRWENHTRERGITQENFALGARFCF